ncbi:MAG: hypothetical protein ACYCWE_11630 [Eubacteriales bacterium]
MSGTGMTIAMSPEFDPSRHKKEDMTVLLDESAKYGIKMILCDGRARWNDAAGDPDG